MRIFLPPRHQGRQSRDLFVKKMRLSFFSFFLVSWCLGGSILPSVVSADQQGGQRPAAYLEYGGGGSQIAMGGAASGTRGDVADGFWNPAGLSGLRGFQVEAQDTLLSLDQKLYFLSLGRGFGDNFFIGGSFFYFTAGDDLETRAGPSFAPDSIFSDDELAFFTTLAVRLSPRWSAGVNLKFLLQTIGNFSGGSGTGIGEDVGIQYRFTTNTTFGFVAQNPYTLFSYGASNQIFPVTLKVGVADEEEKISAKGNFDLEWSSDLGFRPRLGLEWKPAEVIALRGGCWMGNLTAGIGGGSPTLNLSLGIGFTVRMGDSQMELGYNLLPDRIVSGNFLHQISLTGKFL